MPWGQDGLDSIIYPLQATHIWKNSLCTQEYIPYSEEGRGHGGRQGGPGLALAVKWRFWLVCSWTSFFLQYFQRSGLVDQTENLGVFLFFFWLTLLDKKLLVEFLKLSTNSTEVQVLPSRRQWRYNIRQNGPSKLYSIAGCCYLYCPCLSFPTFFIHHIDH